jgi:hypothetical protein
MRDLKADLEWLREPSMQDGECIDDPDILGEYIRECNEIATIAEHALERAIKAEALARELVEAAGALVDDLEWSDKVYASWPPYVQRVEVLLAKAKEVLGDE